MREKDTEEEREIVTHTKRIKKNPEKILKIQKKKIFSIFSSNLQNLNT